MRTLIETIPFEHSSWDAEAAEELLPKLAVKVFKDDASETGLTLVFESDGESYALIQNACPHHFRHQIEFYWMGIEKGHDIASDAL